jgi:hypothetical protein
VIDYQNLLPSVNRKPQTRSGDEGLDRLVLLERMLGCSDPDHGSRMSLTELVGSLSSS